MRNATNSKIRVSVSHLIQKVFYERVMRWVTDTSSLESELITGLSAGELLF